LPLFTKGQGRKGNISFTGWGISGEKQRDDKGKWEKPSLADTEQPTTGGKEDGFYSAHKHQQRRGKNP